MDDRDMEIINLRQEAAKWKNRALECAYEACSRCKLTASHNGEDQCNDCRVNKIKEEAEK